MKSPKSRADKSEVIGAYFGGFFAVSIFAGLIATALEVSSDASHRQVGVDYASTRTTTLYKADGNRVEKWLLDIDSGRRSFAGYVSWADAMPPIGSGSGRSQTDTDTGRLSQYEWINKR